MGEDALRLCVMTPGRKVEQLSSSWGSAGKSELKSAAKALHRMRANRVSKFPQAIVCEP